MFIDFLDRIERIAEKFPEGLERLDFLAWWEEIEAIRSSPSWAQALEALKRGDPKKWRRLRKGAYEAKRRFRSTDDFGAIVGRLLQRREVSMIDLQNIFDVDRHALSADLKRVHAPKARKSRRNRLYDYRHVVAIAKRRLAGGKWLSDTAERNAVFSEIRKRIDEIQPEKSIRRAFDQVMNSGKKR